MAIPQARTVDHAEETGVRLFGRGKHPNRYPGLLPRLGNKLVSVGCAAQRFGADNHGGRRAERIGDLGHDAQGAQAAFHPAGSEIAPILPFAKARIESLFVDDFKCSGRKLARHQQPHGIRTNINNRDRPALRHAPSEEWHYPLPGSVALGRHGIQMERRTVPLIRRDLALKV